jgi:hypothetical protein
MSEVRRIGIESMFQPAIPFLAPIHLNCTAAEGFCKSRAAFEVEKRGDSVPPWT